MAGIYIHIPFCKQRCHYCNFHFSTTFKSYREQMINALLAELKNRKYYLKGEKIQTVYWGGGTPTLLTPREIRSLVDLIRSEFEILSDAEWTIECNPDDLSRELLKNLKNVGFNRLSVGVQSFDDRFLKMMNRAHSSGEAIQSLELARELGFSNISLDLMYGLPDMSLADWEKDLDRALGFKPEHLSCYNLTIEERTALAHKVKKGEWVVGEDDLCNQQFRLLRKKAKEAGLVHYEISNFGREGCFSAHNSAYWKGEKFLGIGPAAHSFDGKNRYFNIANNSEYIRQLEKGEAAGETEVLSDEERYNEYVLTRLRTIWGVQLSDIRNFGQKFESHFQRELASLPQGMITKSEDTIVLTEQGQEVADDLTATLFWA